MRRFAFCLFCVGFILCSMPKLLQAAEGAFSPGFKTVGFLNTARSIRLDVNVWYPTHSKPRSARYGEWTLNVVRFGRAAEGRFPLIILSHDSAATRFSYYNTAAKLAQAGFVVIAPNHKHDNLQRMSHLFTFKQLEERLQDVEDILYMAERHADVRNMIDMQRVGFLGFGTGATVGLMLGDARLDAKGWDDYCAHVPQSAAYCNAWAKGHIQKMLGGLPPLGKSHADKRISALAAVAPKYDMFFTQQALQTVQIPTLLVETQKELGKKAWDNHTFTEFFPPQTAYHLLENIESRDVMAACPPELKKDLPDLCGTATPEVRAASHEVFARHILHFFLEQLGRT